LEPYRLRFARLAIAAGLPDRIERELSAPRDLRGRIFPRGRAHGIRWWRLVAVSPPVLVSRETGWPVVVAAFASLILFPVVN